MAVDKSTPPILPNLTYLHTIVPSWLLNNFGKRFIYAVFIQFDYLLQLALSSRKTSLILKEECGDDAIELKGEEFNLVKYNIETKNNYRARVLRNWEIKETVGTVYGIKLLLELVLGYDTWDIIETTEKASFVVRLNLPHDIDLINPGELDKTNNKITIIRDIIKKQKAAGTICSGIEIQRFDSAIISYPGC